LIEQIYFARVRESLQTARTAEKLYATMPAGEMEANVHHSMGTIYWRNLAFADAERHFSESDRLQEAAHAREGETYPALHGMLLALMGRYQEAEAKFVVAHAMERHNDAGGNRTADWVLSAYARFLCSTSRPREALALAQTGGPDASEIIREGLKTAPRTLLVKGEALIRMGPVEEGLIDIDRADGLALVKFGARAAAQGLPSERTLAMLELGNLAQAEPLIDRAEKMLGAMQADAGVPSRVFWRYRISLLLAQGKLQQARAVLERVRGVLLPADAGLAEAAMVDWLEAGIEQQEGNAVGARRRLESALARIAASPDRTWLREWEAKLQESLGVSLVALGLSSDGQHSFEAALDNYKAFLDPKTSLSVGRVAHRLATLHRQAGRFDHAKHWQSMADDVRRQHPMFEQWVL
jgi:tetratricopeptide (TPR) repeat protein